MNTISPLSTLPVDWENIKMFRVGLFFEKEVLFIIKLISKGPLLINSESIFEF